MKKIFKKNLSAFTPEPVSKIPRRRARFRACPVLAVAIVPVLLFSLASCGKKIDYFDYVSELRSNILVASEGDISLTVYAAEKEAPYAADGVKRTVSPRTEIYLTAPTGVDSYDVSFVYDGKTYGGDMSFDNIKLEYFFSCTLDISAAAELPVKISYDDQVIELTAATVRTENMLSPESVLEKVRVAESEKFKAMTDANGFAGEIYLRLIYEDVPYYYVGIIDREGRIFALLVDSEDGKILAKREM